MIPRSRYLEFFQASKDRLRDVFELVGDVVLVERIKFPETRTASGLIIASTVSQLGTITADRPHFYRVLTPGEGYYDPETKADIPLNTQAGDIVLVGQVSVKLFSSIPLLDSYETDSIGLTRESDIQWRFKGEDKFVSFLAELNDAAKAAKTREGASS